MRGKEEKNTSNSQCLGCSLFSSPPPTSFQKNDYLIYIPDTEWIPYSENIFFSVFADDWFCFCLFHIYKVGNWAQAKIKFLCSKVCFKNI